MQNSPFLSLLFHLKLRLFFWAFFWHHKYIITLVSSFCLCACLSCKYTYFSRENFWYNSKFGGFLLILRNLTLKPFLWHFSCLETVFKTYVWLKYFPKQLNEMLPKATNDYFSHPTEIPRGNRDHENLLLLWQHLKVFKAILSPPWDLSCSLLCLSPLINKSFFSNDLVLPIHPKTNPCPLFVLLWQRSLVIKQFVDVTTTDLHKFLYCLFLKTIFFFSIHMTVSNVFLCLK